MLEIGKFYLKEVFLLMKKIFTFILFVLISFNVAFASDFTIQNDIKYVSKTKAEELWGVKIDFYSGSGLIKIENGNDTYYTKCYTNRFAKNIYLNPFFMNSPKIILDSDIVVAGVSYIFNEEIYQFLIKYFDIIFE